MKHTMKKLLCMALAIMLLVSAVPVFAMADNTVHLVFKWDDHVEDLGDVRISEDTAVVQNLITYHKPSGIPEGYIVTKAWSSNAQKDLIQELGTSVPAGDTVSFIFAPAPAANPDPAPAPDPTYSVKINVKLNSTEQGWYNATIQNSTTTVQNLIDYKVDANLISGYTFKTAYVRNENQYLGADGTVNSGDEIYIAFAKEVEPIKVIVKVGNSDNVVGTTEKVPANGVSAKVGDLLTYAWNSDWDNVYNFDHAWSEGKGDVGKNDSVNAGDTLYIMLKKDGSTSGGSTETPTTPSTSGVLDLTIRVNDTKKYDNDVKNFTKATVGDVIKNIYDSNWTSKYAFDKVEVNGVTYGRSDLEVMAGDEVDVYLTRKYSKDNSNKVYLHVYLNGDASTIAMTKDITGTYLMDDWSTDTTEILKYLKNNYYTAKDTSEAITIDGLYTNTNTNGAFPGNYYADNKVSRLDNIKDKLEDGYVHISVMLKNAKAKSSSTADSSNPKTGDTIFVPVMVMGLTASALAAAYVIGKKRFAR